MASVAVQSVTPLVFTQVIGSNYVPPYTMAFITPDVKSYLLYKLNQEAEFNNDVSLIERTIVEYDKFLLLSLKKQQGLKQGNFPLSPSHFVDLVWLHCHILHTPTYHTMCDEWFHGQYIHHVPAERQESVEERSVALGYYKRTRELYKYVFGVDVPNDIWGMKTPQQDDCEDCRPEACNGGHSSGDCNHNCQDSV